MKKIVTLIIILLGVSIYFFIKKPEEIKKVSPVKPAEKTKTASFVIGGDLMLDRLVYHRFKDKGLEHVFDYLGPRVFAGVDLALVNLEGPISSEAIIDDPTANNMVFEFPPETIKALKYVNIGTVSLANNHTLNAKTEGFEKTKELLTVSGIKYFGNPNTLNEESVLRIASGLPMSVIGLNTLEEFDRERMIEIIRAEGERFVIVYPHWGHEYQPGHSDYQRRLAYEWVDNGADLVVGSHPHVVQDYEVYKDRLIIYSLGNFVFDQTFSPETQEGLLASGVVNDDKVEYLLMPIEIKDLMPRLKPRGAKKINLPYN